MRITFDTGVAGLTPGYTILNAAGTVFQARTGAGVTDLGGGTYSVEVADATLAGCTVVWDTGGAFPDYASESFPATLGYAAPDNAGIGAIAAKTVNLPASPAAVGSAMILTSAYDKAKDDVLTPLAIVGDTTDAVLLKTNTIGGPGAIAWPYTLTVNGLPCADAAVWITSDEAGNNVVASGRTDDFGALVPVPNLDAGTYYFWAKKSGVNFSSPDEEIVVA